MTSRNIDSKCTGDLHFIYWILNDEHYVRIILYNENDERSYNENLVPDKTQLDICLQSRLYSTKDTRISRRTLYIHKKLLGIIPCKIFKIEIP